MPSAGLIKVQAAVVRLMRRSRQPSTDLGDAAICVHNKGWSQQQEPDGPLGFWLSAQEIDARGLNTQGRRSG